MKQRIFALAVLTVVATLMGCRREGSANVRVDPALAALIPPDTKMIVGSKLEALRKLPVYQKHFQDRFQEPMDRFARQTGLDPRKDLWELLVCTDGKESVLMGRGRFMVSDLEPRLVNEGAKRFQYKTYTMFGDDRAAGLFMNASTALVGSTPALKRIIDSRDSKPGGVPPKLAVMVERVPKDAQFWAVFEGGALDLPVAKDDNWANVNQMIKSVESGYLAADLRYGINLNGYADFISDPDAKRVQGALRGILGLARLSTPTDRQDLLKLYDTIDIGAGERKVMLKMNVPEDLVDQLVRSSLMPR